MADDGKPNSESFNVPITEQKMTDDAMTKKREQVMAERNKKLQERMAAMAQRRMKRSVTSGSKQQKETLQTFIKEFTASYEEIENIIDAQQTHQEFKDLKMRAFKLESRLADNASILPAYTFEAKTRMMTNLKKAIQSKQELIAPKPKFSFSQQLKKTSSSPPKKVAAAVAAKADDEQNAADKKEEEDILVKFGINANEIKIENQKLETIYYEAGSINGSDVCLSNLVNCTVSICDYIGALRMDNIKHCNVMTGPICSSLHVEHMEHSTINAIMRQCRIHYCKDTKFYIHVNSEPVIEHSDNVQFAPYNVKYKQLSEHWKASGVDEKVNQWNKVKDFNWFKQQQSPHWSIIPEHERNDVARPVVNDEDSDDEF